MSLCDACYCLDIPKPCFGPSRGLCGVQAAAYHIREMTKAGGWDQPTIPVAESRALFRAMRECPHRTPCSTCANAKAICALGKGREGTVYRDDCFACLKASPASTADMSDSLVHTPGVQTMSDEILEAAPAETDAPAVEETEVTPAEPVAVEPTPADPAVEIDLDSEDEDEDDAEDLEELDD